jgi:hypothetical protein
MSDRAETRASWRLAAAACLARLILVPSVGYADAPPGHVAVVTSGPGAPDVATSVKGSLPAGLVVLEDAEVQGVLKDAKLPAKLKLPLDTGASDALVQVGRSSHIDAFVVVLVQATPHARQVTLEVYDLSHAEPYQTHTVRLGPRPRPADTAQLAPFTRVLVDLKSAAPPVVAPPPPVAPAAPVPPPPAATPAPASETEANHRPEGDPAYSLASVEGGFDLATRAFTYHDGLSSNLKPYSGAVAPAGTMAVEIYPFATTNLVVLKDFGLVGNYRAAFGLSSSNGGTVVNTSWSELGLALRYRVRFGTVKPPVLGLVVGYTREEFVFAVPVPSYPSAAYPAFRAGIDFRVPFGASALSVAGDYLALLSIDGVGQNFRSPSAAGVDASLRYAYAFTKSVEVYALAAWTRYFYTFKPVPGDAWVAGGAIDQMLHGQIGVRATY